MMSTVSSGSAFPVCSSALSPADNFVISNFKSYFSLIVSKTDTAESDSSGPIPSPVIQRNFIHNLVENLRGF